jgi:hypothetical protein
VKITFPVYVFAASPAMFTEIAIFDVLPVASELGLAESQGWSVVTETVADGPVEFVNLTLIVAGDDRPAPAPN